MILSSQHEGSCCGADLPFASIHHIHGVLLLLFLLPQGTQSTRFFLYDRDCRPLASAQVEFPQIYPRAGCAAVLCCQCEAA